jgi:hypothetical protein
VDEVHVKEKLRQQAPDLAPENQNRLKSKTWTESAAAGLTTRLVNSNKHQSQDNRRGNPL